MRLALLIPFLLPTLLFLPRQASAQRDPALTFTVKKYDMADGLLHRRVTCVTQDRDGFLWIATPAGIQRFDGYRFTSYTKAEGLHGDDPRVVLKASDGLIWILYAGPGSTLASGVDILDPRTGRIERFADHFGPDVPIRAEELYVWGQLAADSSILLQVPGKMVSYHASKGFHVVSLKHGEQFLPIIRDQRGVTTGIVSNTDHRGETLVRKDPRGHTVDTLVVGAGIELSWCGTTAAGDAGRLQGTVDNGLYLRHVPAIGAEARELWMSAEGSFKSYPRKVTDKEARIEHRTHMADDLWLVHTTVRRMRGGDDPPQAPVLFDLAERFPEIDFRIHNTMVDRAGHVWICAEFGLYQLDIRPSGFQRFLWQEAIPMGFGNRIRGMVVLEDRLHVNTEGEGYWTLDARTGAKIALDTSFALRYGIASDGAGGLWRGENERVLHEDPGGHIIPLLGAAPLSAWCVFPLTASELLVGTRKGLLVCDVATGASPPVGRSEADRTEAFSALEQGAVLHLARDRSGALWACASTGLFRLDERGRPTERWSSTSDSAHILPSSDIRHFTEHHDVFWLATGDGGIIRWDRARNTVRSLSRRDGLPSNTVHVVYFDAAGLLWAPTDNGLVRYDPETGQVTVFTTADGIAHNEFNRLAHGQGPDGRLYFGGLNGITAFDPRALHTPKESAAPPLMITSVQQFSSAQDRVVDRTSAVRAGGRIELLPGDRSVNIAFALLSFEDPKGILYGWRIDGIDADWNYQHEPDLRITSLPYGDHDLRIKAQGSNGLWGAQELVLPIHVAWPFYLRWWFIALCVLAAAAIVYTVFRYRLQQAKKVYAMRDRIAADLHDEVGSSLSNIAMFGELMRDQAGDQPPRMQRMIERVTSNSAKALESMNDIVWNVNTRFEGTEHLIARMRSFAAQVAEARGFALKFTVDDAIQGVKLDMERRKNVYLIFKEAVNNAAKYSECTQLSVRLNVWGKGLRLHVADDGRGFTQGEVHPAGGGHGLTGMARRAALIGAWLNVVTKPGEGTSITLEVGSGAAASRRLGTRGTNAHSSFVL